MSADATEQDEPVFDSGAASVHCVPLPEDGSDVIFGWVVVSLQHPDLSIVAVHDVDFIEADGLEISDLFLRELDRDETTLTGFGPMDDSIDVAEFGLQLPAEGPISVQKDEHWELIVIVSPDADRDVSRSDGVRVHYSAVGESPSGYFDYPVSMVVSHGTSCSDDPPEL